MLTMGLVAVGVTDVPRSARFWRDARTGRSRAGTAGFDRSRPDGADRDRRTAARPRRTNFACMIPRRRRCQQTAEAARLVSLGAVRVDWDSYPDDPDFVVLADPDGNRFCIVDLSHGSD